MRSGLRQTCTYLPATLTGAGRQQTHQVSWDLKKMAASLLGTSALLVVTSASLLVTMCLLGWRPSLVGWRSSPQNNGRQDGFARNRDWDGLPTVGLCLLFLLTCHRSVFFAQAKAPVFIAFECQASRAANGAQTHLTRIIAGRKPALDQSAFHRG